LSFHPKCGLTIGDAPAMSWSMTTAVESSSPHLHYPYAVVVEAAEMCAAPAAATVVVMNVAPAAMAAVNSVAAAAVAVEVAEAACNAAPVVAAALALAAVVAECSAAAAAIVVAAGAAAARLLSAELPSAYHPSPDSMARSAAQDPPVAESQSAAMAFAAAPEFELLSAQSSRRARQQLLADSADCLLHRRAPRCAPEVRRQIDAVLCRALRARVSLADFHRALPSAGRAGLDLARGR
jgi:hypothetical protein